MKRLEETHQEGTALLLVGSGQVGHRVEDLDARVIVNVDVRSIIGTEERDVNVYCRRYMMCEGHTQSRELHVQKHCATLQRRQG
jgi:hypothetical protein